MTQTGRISVSQAAHRVGEDLQRLHFLLHLGLREEEEEEAHTHTHTLNGSSEGRGQIK